VAGPVEIVILAGGQSARMGRDKARLKLGRRTLLGHARAAARETGWPVRVLRRDAVPRCGPLGGIVTALQRSRHDAVVFLSCDLPFVSAAAIRRVGRAVSARRLAAFFEDDPGVVGFPFALRREALPVVRAQIERRRFSLQKLAAALGARRLRVPARQAWRWFNVNTPADLAEARQRYRRVARSSKVKG